MKILGMNFGGKARDAARNDIGVKKFDAADNLDKLYKSGFDSGDVPTAKNSGRMSSGPSNTSGSGNWISWLFGKGDI